MASNSIFTKEWYSPLVLTLEERDLIIERRRDSDDLTRFRSLRAIKVECTNTNLVITYMNGVELRVPLDWYPRLYYGTPAERANYVIVGDSIHWEDLDEDLHDYYTIICGKSCETSASIEDWKKEHGKL